MEFRNSKVDFVEDSKIRYAGTFTITGEDHTIGNVVRMQLLKDRRVKFAGYIKPHPLEEKIQLKVQTNGEVNPGAAMEDSMRCLGTELEKMKDKFDKEVNNFKGQII